MFTNLADLNNFNKNINNFLTSILLACLLRSPNKSIITFLETLPSNSAFNVFLSYSESSSPSVNIWQAKINIFWTVTAMFCIYSPSTCDDSFGMNIFLRNFISSWLSGECGGNAATIPIKIR